MLDRPQHRIMGREPCRDIGGDPPRLRQRRERVDRRGRAQSRLAAAVDELVDLREKLDFADAAAPALEVVAGTEVLALREMVADAVATRGDFLKLTENEAAAPDERRDRRQTFAATGAVAG